MGAVDEGGGGEVDGGGYGGDCGLHFVAAALGLLRGAAGSGVIECVVK